MLVIQSSFLYVALLPFLFIIETKSLFFVFTWFINNQSEQTIKSRLLLKTKKYKLIFGSGFKSIFFENNKYGPKTLILS